MLPCATMNVTQQIDTLINELKANNVKYDIIWMKIETNTENPSCDWSQLTPQQSCDFILEAGDYSKTQGRMTGFGASKDSWKLNIGK